MRPRILLVLGLLFAGSCSGDHGATTGGTIVIAAFAEPDNLLPPIGRTLAAKAVTDVLFDKLAEAGPGLNTVGDEGFVPRLAQRWEWSHDSLQVTFHLDPRARWHDGRPVRSPDVRFAFSVYTDTVVNANGGSDLRAVLDSITVIDTLTCRAWFKRRAPEQFFTLTNTLVPLPEHLLRSVPRDSMRAAPFARQPVGSGPFRFVRWDPGARIEVAATDSFYRGRARLDRAIWSIAPEMGTATQRLMAGEADFLEALTPGALRDVAKSSDVRAVPYGSFDYGFVRLNLHDGASPRPHPLFGDRSLRRALTMALDRRAMRKSVFDSLARDGLGPFVRAQWSSDTTLAQLPFDRAAASRMLDSLGWVAGAGGTRAKGGRALEFTLLTPSSSKSRSSYAVLIQEELRQVGVKVDIASVDFNAFMARSGAHEFDALMDGRHVNPSPAGIRESWSSAGIAGGRGPNTGQYSNAAFDAQVDSAVQSFDSRLARRHFRAAYQAIIDDAPAIWLFEPVAVAGVSARLQVGALHPGEWWSGLEGWSLTPGARRR